MLALPAKASRAPIFPAGSRSPLPAAPAGRSDERTGWLSFRKVTQATNLSGLTFRLPLQRLVCLSGVSGSGKSTLLNHVIRQGLLTQRRASHRGPGGDWGGAQRCGIYRRRPGRSVAPRAHPPFEPGPLYRSLGPDPRTLCAHLPAAQAAPAAPPPAFRSTGATDAATIARASATSASKCSFSPMSSCPARFARAGVLSRKSSRSRGKGGPSRTSWR